MSSVKQVYQKMFDNIKEAQLLRTQIQHKYVKLRKFQVGDTVFIKTKDTFKPRYIGLFTIVKVLSSYS